MRLAGIDREMVTLRSENERLRSKIGNLSSELTSVRKVYQEELNSKQELVEKYKNQEQQILGLEEQVFKIILHLNNVSVVCIFVFIPIL